jgi:hypothetical protein
MSQWHLVSANQKQFDCRCFAGWIKLCHYFNGFDDHFREAIQFVNNNNTPALLRALIVYATCVPLAVFLGYLLASESETSQGGHSIVAWNVMALFESNPIAWSCLVVALCSPLLLRWHHFLLVACWNFGMILFFLPGHPPVWLPMVCLSLGISILHRTLNSNARFISAPQITWPLIFLTAVVLFTAEMTGGIGLKSLGNEVSGGKSYVLLLVGILGYFALAARRIPPNRVVLYVGLFYLGGCTSVIGDLAAYVPSSLYFIFQFFPASGYDLDTGMGAVEKNLRFAGLGALGEGGVLFMLAIYGIRGIFLSGKPWRLLLLAFFFLSILFGGFRSTLIFCLMIFAIQFSLERMHQTKLFPVFIFCGIIMVVLLVPFASKLPFAVQRSLAFLPLPISMEARNDAQGTADWRLQIWKDMLPQVPQYLLLGKGYALSQTDLQFASSSNFRYLSDAEAVGFVGNYHSGPLSVVVPFGMWGIIGIFWFWIACLFALYKNYRYGEQSIKVINIFLFASFVAKIILFIVVFGSLYGDMANFVGIIGLSVSLNGGIRRSTAKPVQTESEPQVTRVTKPQFQSFFQR